MRLTHNIGRVVLALAIVWAAAMSTQAQQTFGYTTLDYDEESNTMIGYSETSADYSMQAVYKVDVELTVVNSNAGFCGWGTSIDQYGWASVLVECAAEGGITYLADSTHRLSITMYEYVYEYDMHYFDDWYFSSFHSQNVYAPGNYTFQSPGYYQVRTTDPTIRLGQTHDEETVAPSVTITGPSTAVDGASVAFSGSVGSGATPTGYQWSFTTPGGSGNNPDLSFSNATSPSTSATAKWFANPNNDCSASANSTYTVKLTVSFSGGGSRSKKQDFTVSIPSDGAVVNAVPSWSGGPSIIQNSSGLWVVASIGSFAANPNAVKQIFVLPTSQFFNKVDAHENVHLQQWGDSGLMGQHIQPGVYFNRIQNFTDPSQSGLATKLTNEFAQFKIDAVANAKNEKTPAEIAAYAVSDPMAPMFFYQRCGRTTF